MFGAKRNVGVVSWGFHLPGDGATMTSSILGVQAQSLASRLSPPRLPSILRGFLLSAPLLAHRVHRKLQFSGLSDGASLLFLEAQGPACKLAGS